VSGSGTVMERKRVDDLQAILALKRGDLGGLETLVRRHQLRAIRAAYLIVRDRALAEDIVQSAFLRAYDRIGQFDASRPFAPWFLRSVVNDALKAAARGARHVSLETPAAGAPDDQAPTLADLLADPEPGPEDLAEAAEQRQAVWRALGQLPPAERAAIVRRYYLDRSEREMAGELNTPPGTIKWRLHAARERLRAWLGPALGGAAQAAESLPPAAPPLDHGGER
jgi:RNA polymerase sigma-70 factor (ECF subfamily)